MPTRPWLPTDLSSATLEGWYFLRDATGAKADGANVTLASGKASRWTDASGKARHLSQPAGGVLPAYDAVGLDGSGRPAIVTTDSNQGLAATFANAYPASKILGAFAVMKLTANGRAVVFSGPGTNDYDYNAGGQMALMLDGNVQFWYNFTSRNVPYVLNTPALYEGYANTDTSGVAQINGGTPSGAVTITAANAARTLDHIGVLSRSHNAVGEGARAALSEVVVIAGPPSTLDLQKLEGYLAWNNGTQASLPAGHPYKAAAPTVTMAGGIILPRRRQLILL